MNGKICLITGGSRGIGEAAAVGLAQRGAEVVIVARSQERGAAAVERIQARSGNERVSVLLAALSVQAQVRQLAQTFSERHDRLDVLINNAGAINAKRTLTADGIETTLAVNHLAPFLFTNLLLPLLERSALGEPDQAADPVEPDHPARIITVSSDAHRGATISTDNLQGEQKYSAWRAYGQSKLANILFTEELARRLSGAGVTANCLHPGLVSTGFGKNDRSPLRLLMTLIGPFLTQPEGGAQTILYLASSPDVATITGKYFVRCRPVTPQLPAGDEIAAEWLWQRSAELTGLDETSH